MTKLSNISDHWKNDQHNPDLTTFLRLGKFSVVFPVSLTAFTAYFLYKPSLNAGVFLLSLGVLFLAMAASAINQVQEAGTDAVMQRTRNRPVPANEISHAHTILFIVFCLLTGSILIWLYGTPVSLFLGYFTILWYNGVYTYLKKITAFAVIPGSLTGAIPPLIGWSAAGGSITDLTALILAFIFFIGQVPHFWLLMLKYGDQYKQAGLPSITEVFSKQQIKRLSFSWISASLACSLLLVMFGVIHSKPFGILLLIAAVIVIIQFRKMLFIKENISGNMKYFILLNAFYLLVMVLLIVDRVF